MATARPRDRSQAIPEGRGRSLGDSSAGGCPGSPGRWSRDGRARRGTCGSSAAAPMPRPGGISTVRSVPSCGSGRGIPWLIETGAHPAGGMIPAARAGDWTEVQEEIPAGCTFPRPRAAGGPDPCRRRRTRGYPAGRDPGARGRFHEGAGGMAPGAVLPRRIGGAASRRRGTDRRDGAPLPGPGEGGGRRDGGYPLRSSRR